MARLRGHPRLIAGIALCLLLAYAVTSLGILPSPSLLGRWAGLVIDSHYPCAGGGCGCPSAVECWTNCRCHSEHERLVWALRRGVMPPSYAPFTADQWGAAIASVQPGTQTTVDEAKDQLRRGIALGHADEEQVASCCQSEAAPDPADDECCGRAAQSEPAASDCPDCGKGWRPSLSALSCRGLDQILLFTPPPARPAPFPTEILPEPSTASIAPPADESAESRPLETPEPPPRLSPRTA